jgi:hypothetical protein
MAERWVTTRTTHEPNGVTTSAEKRQVPMSMSAQGGMTREMLKDRIWEIRQAHPERQFYNIAKELDVRTSDPKRTVRELYNERLRSEQATAASSAPQSNASLQRPESLSALVVRLRDADPTRAWSDIAAELNVTQKSARDAYYKGKERQRRAEDRAALAKATPALEAAPSRAHVSSSQPDEDAAEDVSGAESATATMARSEASPFVPAAPSTSPSVSDLSPTTATAPSPALSSAFSPPPSYGAHLLQVFDDFTWDPVPRWTSQARREDWMGFLERWKGLAAGYAGLLPIGPHRAEENLAPERLDGAIAAALSLTRSAIAPERLFVEFVRYSCAAVLQKLPSHDRGWASESRREEWLTEIDKLVMALRYMGGMVPIREAQEDEGDARDGEQ